MPEITKNIYISVAKWRPLQNLPNWPKLTYESKPYSLARTPPSESSTVPPRSTSAALASTVTRVGGAPQIDKKILNEVGW